MKAVIEKTRHLENIIRKTVIESVRVVLNDPDFKLELHEEIAKRLKKYNDKKDEVTEEDVLRWSKEARELKKKGKLRTFKSLIGMEYPSLAKKYHV